MGSAEDRLLRRTASTPFTFEVEAISPAGRRARRPGPGRASSPSSRHRNVQDQDGSSTRPDPATFYRGPGFGPGFGLVAVTHGVGGVVGGRVGSGGAQPGQQHHRGHAGDGQHRKAQPIAGDGDQ